MIVWTCFIVISGWRPPSPAELWKVKANYLVQGCRKSSSEKVQKGEIKGMQDHSPVVSDRNSTGAEGADSSSTIPGPPQLLMSDLLGPWIRWQVGLQRVFSASGSHPGPPWAGNPNRTAVTIKQNLSHHLTYTPPAVIVVVKIHSSLVPYLNINISGAYLQVLGLSVLFFFFGQTGGGLRSPPLTLSSSVFWPGWKERVCDQQKCSFWDWTCSRVCDSG